MQPQAVSHVPMRSMVDSMEEKTESKMTMPLTTCDRRDRLGVSDMNSARYGIKRIFM